jgi:hypothetical protein
MNLLLFEVAPAIEQTASQAGLLTMKAPIEFSRQPGQLRFRIKGIDRWSMSSSMAARRMGRRRLWRDTTAGSGSASGGRVSTSFDKIIR